MTAQSRDGGNVIENPAEASPSQGSNRCATLVGTTRHAHESSRSVEPPNPSNAFARPAQRLRQILTANPRARHFSVQQIISELGEAPQGPTLALFSAAGALDARDVGHLSGVVTSAIGVQFVLRRRVIVLPRAVLKRKIPRSSLETLIGAISNLLEKTEAVVRRRWAWMFHPGVGIALGVVLFLLGVATTIPFLGMTISHPGAAFIVSIGLAEQDGLLVVVGAIAGILALAVMVADTISGRKILATAKNWLVDCLKRVRLRVAAWFLDRIEKGLGDLLRIEWNEAILLFLCDFAGPRIEDPAVVGVRIDRSLKERARRIRLAESQRVRAFFGEPGTGSLCAGAVSQQRYRCENATSRESGAAFRLDRIEKRAGAGERAKLMELEQFYVYEIIHPLTPERKTFIETHIDVNATTFGQNVTRSWHRGEDEHILRIFVEPVIIEIVFLGQRVELYGAAPAWARLLFTNGRKEELRERIEDVLIGAGFVTPQTLEAQRRPKRKLFARARERNDAP